MLSYQTRVLEERNQLKERYEKLSEFIASEIFKKLSRTGQALLRTQHFHMGEYLAILEERIDNFTEV